MTTRQLLASLMLLASGSAFAACGSIRFAYPDQHRPPYWLGNGQDVPEVAGAGVELVRALAASQDCSLALVRLPIMRLRAALASGQVDMSPVDISSDGQPGIAIPRDALGKPDFKRATPVVVVAFVRSKDGIKPDADPIEFMRNRQVGVMFGAQYSGMLQQAGASVDQGGASAISNFEKLLLGRIDAFVVSLISAADMDKFITARYRGEIVRLEKPLLKTQVWIGANQTYYDAHRNQVETMWSWLGGEGNQRYLSILKKYTEQ